MSKVLVFAVIGLVALAGCRQDDLEAHSSRRERADALAGCVARIAIYPATNPPQQPFRVVAPVAVKFADGNWGWTTTSRFLRMKKRACELGADAIIDADEQVENNVVATTTLQYDADGRPTAIVQEQPRPTTRRTTPLAIQFVAMQ